MQAVNRRTSAHPDFLANELPRFREVVGQRVKVTYGRYGSTASGVLTEVKARGRGRNRRFYLVVDGTEIGVMTVKLVELFE